MLVGGVRPREPAIERGCDLGRDGGRQAVVGHFGSRGMFSARTYTRVLVMVSGFSWPQACTCPSAVLPGSGS